MRFCEDDGTETAGTTILRLCDIYRPTEAELSGKELKQRKPFYSKFLLRKVKGKLIQFRWVLPCFKI